MTPGFEAELRRRIWDMTDEEVDTTAADLQSVIMQAVALIEEMEGMPLPQIILKRATIEPGGMACLAAHVAAEEPRPMPQQFRDGVRARVEAGRERVRLLQAQLDSPEFDQPSARVSLLIEEADLAATAAPLGAWHAHKKMDRIKQREGVISALLWIASLGDQRSSHGR
jgi:hypothetical protein